VTRETQRSVGADPPLAVDDLVDPARRYVQGHGQGVTWRDPHILMDLCRI
jgi:hypothetical protein